MLFLTNTFSPMMLSEGTEARVRGINPQVALRSLQDETMTSAISHEVTARVFSALAGREIQFSRVNLQLRAGDQLLVIIPSFRATEAREFTLEEVTSSPVRAFWVEVFAA